MKIRKKCLRAVHLPSSIHCVANKAQTQSQTNEIKTMISEWNQFALRKQSSAWLANDIGSNCKFRSFLAPSKLCDKRNIIAISNTCKAIWLDQKAKKRRSKVHGHVAQPLSYIFVFCGYAVITKQGHSLIWQANCNIYIFYFLYVYELGAISI